MKIKFLKAFNGDAIWISFENDGVQKNVIIDGGIGKTYIDSSKRKGELFDVIESIKEKGEFVDLLVLTHFDDDHIGGILKWLDKDQNASTLIKKVWFNSGKEIANKFEIAENHELDIQIQGSAEVFQTSPAQGINFEKYLKDNYLWEGMIIEQGEVYELLGLTFKILSPNKDKLAKLLKLYRKQIDYFTSSGEYDFDTTLQDFIIEENTSKFIITEDSAVANGSSIAFIMVHENNNYLFLGDSHPSVIVEGLKHFGFNKSNPLSVELMKISHHASMYNTTKELLEIIETDNYFVCSNASKHGLPNKRTIARIIANSPNANILFNYDLKDEVFSEQDWIDFPFFRASVTNEFN